MSDNEGSYVVCVNGVFILPEHVYKSLATLVLKGFVYIREDEDVLTISTVKIAGGHRRVFNSRYRAPMFRNFGKLAIVNLHESIRIMAVETAKASRRARRALRPAGR
jgi:hypothetical protein